MNKRQKMLVDFYENIDEDSRLQCRQSGKLEYITSMEYIHKYLNEGAKIMEIGAGTGRYSLALAEEGYDVTAVELVEKNLMVLRKKVDASMKIQAYQGDALDLSRFEDGLFDVTLVFGPFYHIYNRKDVDQVINEAIRITKKDGVILCAFLSMYEIMNTNYLTDDFRVGVEENFTEDFQIKHFEEQLFTGYDIVEFEQLFQEKNVVHLTTVGVDSVMELVENVGRLQLTEDNFEVFLKYHLATCEKRELLGCSSHLLYICRKM